MKRSERHHLKENELAISLRRARAVAEQHRREITFATIGILVILAASVGYLVWRQRTNGLAEERLADALTIAEAPVVPVAPASTTGATPAPTPGSYPSERAKLEAALPKLLSAAEAYPSTTAGVAARYYAASALAALGRSQDAVVRYEEVVQRAGDGIYGQMARLGKADALGLSGHYDQAVTIYRELSARKDLGLPIDGVLMRLGRTYAAAGKSAEARQTFNRIVEEFPDSPYSAEARQQLQALPEASTST